ncbi:MAG: phosphate ABC transporter substrate-binding protein [Candidatus Ratteibacteria bacterium]
MKRIMLGAAAFFILAGSVAYGFQRANKLTLQGSTTVLPVAQRAAEDFMKKYSAVNVTVRGGGSGTGINALLAGTTDIADSSRPITRAEKEKLASTGGSAVEYKISLDGLVLIVNTSNPINNLTTQQAKEIFTGEITNWNEVGGRDEKIVLVSRDTSSGTYDSFKELVLKGANPAATALLQASNQAVATTVGQTPSAIGYVGLGYMSDKTKSLTMNGIQPSVETVKKGKYPLRRYLYMYTNGQAKGLAASFINFVLSAEGQKIVAEEGFVPLN